MSNAIDGRPAHSASEAVLCVVSSDCRHCRTGPFRIGEVAGTPGPHGKAALTVHATCEACGVLQEFCFEVPAGASQVSTVAPVLINPTADPSHLLDVGQWLVVARRFIERAERMGEKREGRLLRLAAAACLTEALKFYDDLENDLPPREACFIAVTRSRFQDAPEQFSRRRLTEMLHRLPSLNALKGRTALVDELDDQRPWWIRWA